MKITMCESKNTGDGWLKSVSFCCSTMTEEFFRGTFGFSDYLSNLTIPFQNKRTTAILYCPYCQERIEFIRLVENENSELSIVLYNYEGNSCDYITMFSVCCEMMNILSKKYLGSLPEIASPTKYPIEINRGGIRLNDLGIKGCPYCGTELERKRTYNFEIN